MGDSPTVVNYAHRFAPAAADETHVFGSCAPGWHSAGDHSTAIDEWIRSMRDRGIERVCCLLSGTDLDERGGNVARYRRSFGDEHVLHVPTADHDLLEDATLDDEILPFLRDSADRNMPVVVHGLTGIGRTGQVLAAWLVAHREYEPREAVHAVRETGRDPREPVHAGNASMAELRALLRSVQ